MKTFKFFIGYTDSWFFYDNNALLFTSGGVNRLIIHANGNVGIGV
jgi:hypothetical protein